MRKMRIAEYENRQMERFSLDLDGLLSIDERAEEGLQKLQTIDISAGGALFQTIESVALGTDVSVDLILPLERFKEIKTRRALIEVSGKVIRKDQNGMAVCFDSRYKISPIDN